MIFEKKWTDKRYGHKYGRMEIKTTIEIDEVKLKAVMSLSGLKTRKEAVDWALTEALRIATINQIAKNPWSSAFLEEAVNPDYDVMETRKRPVTYEKKEGGQ